MLYTEDQKDFNISRICFGGASVSGEGAGYGFGDISKNDSIKLIEESFEVGINIFDTAPIYGFGESEKRIGQALKSKRDKLIKRINKRKKEKDQTTETTTATKE